MRLRLFFVAVIVFTAYGCATTAPVPPQPDVMRGTASWYGQEFAGRTTANGEIFDPLLLTAAHRTLPFGTVVDVLNPKTNQSVRVRINDRGPYVGNRVIDLSYAAAQVIGLIEPGKGDVDIRIVKMGRGEREPPAPYEVNIAAMTEQPAMPAPRVEAPKVEFPLPSGETVKEPAADSFAVEVQEQRSGVATRKQVSADGRTIVEVPIPESSTTVRTPAPPSPTALRRPTPAIRRPGVHGFFVQVGAFALEANANALASRLERIGQKAWVSREELFRVRIGPFPNRDEAVRTRENLEANGLSAMIVKE
jgi:rare lipoprotein A